MTASDHSLHEFDLDVKVWLLVRWAGGRIVIGNTTCPKAVCRVVRVT